MEVIITLVVWGLLSWGVAEMASSRGRSWFGFFLLSFLLSPLLGLIVVLVMKNVTQEVERELQARREEASRELDRKREHEKQIESLRALTSASVKSNSTNQSNVSPAVSIADELAKLAELRDKGVLTSDEFEKQKRAILNTPSMI